MVEIPIAAGRRAFGADPANYDSARPDYPAEVFALLRARCGLAPGTRTFEIGPGTGVATRALIANGAKPLVAIEPDGRLAAKLKERSPDAVVTEAAFEDAVLEDGTFDLGCAATSFHWMEQRPALAKVARLLRPGGWWAAWWNVFGDPERADPFHDATLPLLSGTASSPSQPNWKHPFALDTEARLGDLRADGLFEDCAAEMLRWTLVLDPKQVRALYATYSQFSVLEDAERRRILDGLFEIAERQFAGRVERNMVTAIYAARRR
jgi:SAM-dependent methyltransferase